MHSPKLVAFDTGWQAGLDLPLLSMAAESSRGKRYCRAHAGLSCERNAAYYV